MSLLTSFLSAFFEDLTHSTPCASIDQAFMDLHRGYTSGSHETMVIKGHQELIAYILARRPATYAAVSKVAYRLKEMVPYFHPHSLLDIGAGPLTAIHALSHVYGEDLHHFVCLESHPLFCSLIRQIDTALHENNKREEQEIVLQLLEGDVTHMHTTWNLLAGKTYDVGVASYSLGEIAPSLLLPVIEQICTHTKTFIAIEPGTPRGWATLMKVREHVCHKLGWHIIAPCPHSKVCPFTGTSAWCHETVRCERSRYHKAIKHGTLGYEDEPFSYLIVSRDHEMLREKEQHTPPSRIVHRPLHRSGHSCFVLCTPSGSFADITVSRKHKELYKQAKKLEWGDSFPSESQQERTAEQSDEKLFDTSA